MNEKKKNQGIDFEAINELYKNMKKFGCKYCLFEAKRMEMGKTMFPSKEELLNHIEMEHDFGLPRDGESEEQTWNRVKAKNPRLGTPECRCPECKYGLNEVDMTMQMINEGILMLKNGTTYIAEIDEPMIDMIPMPSERGK